jgi:hypothetical protein
MTVSPRAIVAVHDVLDRALRARVVHVLLRPRPSVSAPLPLAMVRPTTAPRCCWEGRGGREGGARARLGDVHLEDLIDCPGRKPPFLVFKRPARPYKSHIQNIFT